jgi:hypothetical protein
VRVFVETQWYVGEANGRVAVYQGIPATVAGFHFSHVEVQTTIPAAEVEALPSYEQLPDGITADSRAEAFQIIDRIRDQLELLRNGADQPESSP